MNSKKAISLVRRHFLPGALILITVCSAIQYFADVPDQPSGFYLDESSISYNAYLVSQTGHDEFGIAWPLYFQAFGDYKNPVYIYLLAGLFRFTGPSILTARMLSSAVGFVAALLFGLLAFRITNNRVIALIMILTALLTPWLFELSRVVLEVALYPLVLVLFLLCVFRATRRPSWSWRETLSLTITLALITYTYSIGRLLGPLLAIGLVALVTRQRSAKLLLTWTLYALTFVPVVVFHLQHPGALTGRFSIVTYLTRQNSKSNLALEFLKHYFGNVNPWRLFVRGDPNAFQITHIYGAELLLIVTGLLAIAGLVLVVRQSFHDAWWRFVIYALVVSVVPASLTNDYVHTLRLIPFAVFLIVLTIPSLEWLMRKHRHAVLSVLVVFMMAQGAAFQSRFHREKLSQKRLDLFDNEYLDKIFLVAVNSSNKPIYLEDAPGTPGYIQAYWYATLRSVPKSSFAQLPPDAAAPPGALVISTEPRCLRCEIIGTSNFYKLYIVTGAAPERKPLKDFHAGLRILSAPSIVEAGEQFTLRVAVKNEGDTVWLAQERTAAPLQVSLGNHWCDSTGRVIINDDGRTPVLQDVRPGQEIEMGLTVNAPMSPGKFIVEIDMVQEGVSWFGLRGSTTLRLPIQVH